MQTVLKEKYVDTPVAWGDVVRTGPIKKRLLVIGFDNENGDALKSLEDKTLVKYHKSCEFVKLPYEKDGEAAKKWSVDKTPTVVVCDASENILAKLEAGALPPQGRDPEGDGEARRAPAEALTRGACYS